MSLKFPYAKATVAQYLNELGSQSSAPGGGSGAALTAATGAALVEMVVGINKQSTEKIKKIRRKLEGLMTEDAQAFQKISKFFKTKKKGVAYQKALENGAHVPMEICGLCGEAVKLGSLEIGRTSRWLASDLAESGILLEAAFRSARLNVEINLRFMENQTFVQKARRRLEEIERQMGLSTKKLGEVFKI